MSTIPIDKLGDIWPVFEVHTNHKRLYVTCGLCRWWTATPSFQQTKSRLMAHYDNNHPEEFKRLAGQLVFDGM